MSDQFNMRVNTLLPSGILQTFLTILKIHTHRKFHHAYVYERRQRIYKYSRNYSLFVLHFINNYYIHSMQLHYIGRIIIHAMSSLSLLFLISHRVCPSIMSCVIHLSLLNLFDINDNHIQHNRIKI